MFISLYEHKVFCIIGSKKLKINNYCRKKLSNSIFE